MTSGRSSDSRVQVTYNLFAALSQQGPGNDTVGLPVHSSDLWFNALDFFGCFQIGLPHQCILNLSRRTKSLEPSTIAVNECVPSDFADTGLDRLRLNVIFENDAEYPTLLVALRYAPTLGLCSAGVRTMRGNQDHTVPSQPFAQRTAVMAFVGDYPHGLLSWTPRTMSSSYPDRLERLLFPEEHRGRPNSQVIWRNGDGRGDWNSRPARISSKQKQKIVALRELSQFAITQLPQANHER